MGFVPWIAISLLCAGYMAQIHKIHVHKEVRDLSIIGYLSWGLGYLVLAYEAYTIDSNVFLAKNGITLALVIIIVAQIWCHRDAEWHDDEDTQCNCGNEIEPHWSFCPDCGEKQEKL